MIFAKSLKLQSFPLLKTPGFTHSREDYSLPLFHEVFYDTSWKKQEKVKKEKENKV